LNYTYKFTEAEGVKIKEYVLVKERERKTLTWRNI
jgi:hypothetical protein